MKHLSPATWIIAVIMMFASSAALGQPGYHLLPSKVKLGPWTFNPIYIKSVDGSASVESLLALADANALVGDNIVAVWYNRQPDGTWEAKAWGGADVGTAVSYVTQALEIPAEEKGLWSVPGVESDIDNIEPPSDYSGGILLSDPLAAVVLYSPDRDIVVDYLTSIGYATANIPVDKEEGCTSDARLDTVAGAMGETLTGDNDTMASRAALAFSLGCDTIGGVIVVEGPYYAINTPFGPVSFSCENTVNWGTGTVTQCWHWSQTRSVQKFRTVVCITVGPPRRIVTCNQSSLGVETFTRSCCAILTQAPNGPPVPACPNPAPVPPTGNNCVASTGIGSTVQEETTYTWNQWGPSCTCISTN